MSTTKTIKATEYKATSKFDKSIVAWCSEESRLALEYMNTSRANQYELAKKFNSQYGDLEWWNLKMNQLRGSGDKLQAALHKSLSILKTSYVKTMEDIQSVDLSHSVTPWDMFLMRLKADAQFAFKNPDFDGVPTRKQVKGTDEKKADAKGKTKRGARNVKKATVKVSKVEAVKVAAELVKVLPKSYKTLHAELAKLIKSAKS